MQGCRQQPHVLQEAPHNRAVAWVAYDALDVFTLFIRQEPLEVKSPRGPAQLNDLAAPLNLHRHVARLHKR